MFLDQVITFTVAVWHGSIQCTNSTLVTEARRVPGLATLLVFRIPPKVAQLMSYASKQTKGVYTPNPTVYHTDHDVPLNHDITRCEISVCEDDAVVVAHHRSGFVEKWIKAEGSLGVLHEEVVERGFIRERPERYHARNSCVHALSAIES